ncbi:MAG: RagB/SusD family nutrient uptake outer membrane protein [Spirosomataceae bacterium]
MKKIHIIPILLTLLMGTLTGCEKLLEEIPPSRYQISTLNKPLLDAFVIGAYEPLARSRGRLWESTMTRDIEGCAEYCQLPAGGGTDYMNYNFEPRRNDNGPRWTTFYEAIGKANLLIKTIDDDKTLATEIKAPFKAEALFIRATCYWWLTRMLGAVPLRLTPIPNSNDTALPLSDSKVIIDQIIKDLAFCETNLPVKVPESNAGRATQGAAKMMLAEIYLWNKDYTNARAKAKEVIDNKAKYGYDLVKSLETLFSPSAPTNSEEIFAIKFTQQTALGSFLPTYAFEARALQAGLAARGIAALMVRNAPLVRDWDKKDLRRSWNLIDTITIGGVKTKASLISGASYMFGKYRDGAAPEETAAGNDFYLYRFAEAYLIFAECENQVNGPTPAAYDAVNQVRRRAYGVDFTKASAVADFPAGLSKAAFDDLIFQERGYEFMYECKRWFDMVRTGRADAVAKAAGKTPTGGSITRFTYYLPDIELTNNPLIK